MSYDSLMYFIGGAEQRFKRQMNVISYNPASGDDEFVKLKSYPWWH
ncbi:MAG: hypothetical protein PF518_18420 [Spirochaetaceae bacterium]|nr:hypothetical protein [Spirochaetaceae bacterium]